MEKWIKRGPVAGDATLRILTPFFEMLPEAWGHDCQEHRVGQVQECPNFRRRKYVTFCGTEIQYLPIFVFFPPSWWHLQEEPKDMTCWSGQPALNWVAVTETSLKSLYRGNRGDPIDCYIYIYTRYSNLI